ncbi:MAG: hypothetical protein RMJ31_06655 [Nitrososphaerota archaeon]|nr:hypothetical protein [Nitrososphaerales archaeon]MDW8045433.1 hypothetical protein [Nitrososphaerota archaeon]
MEEAGRGRLLLKAIRRKRLKSEPFILNDEVLSKYAKLKEVLHEADIKYQDVITRYPEKYYKLFLAPGIIGIDQDEAEDIIRFLQIKPKDLINYESRIIKYNDKFYKVWLSIHRCG